MEILLLFKFSGFHVLWKCLKPLVYNPITDTDWLLFSKKTRRYLLTHDKLSNSTSTIQVPSIRSKSQHTVYSIYKREHNPSEQLIVQEPLITVSCDIGL